MNIRIVLLVGAAVISAVVSAYCYYVGSWGTFSTSAQDWGFFGDYFGGVTGSIFAFISAVLIVYTVQQQREQIEAAQDEALKLDVLRYVSTADEEIERWLQKKVIINGGVEVEFGDVVWGLAQASETRAESFSAAVNRLFKLTCMYCGALALYKDNVNPHFIFQYHRQKASELVAFLEKHQSKLGAMAGPSLQFCKMHIGESGNT